MNDMMRALAAKISELVASIGLEKPDPEAIVSYFTEIIARFKITNDFDIKNHMAESSKEFMRDFGLSEGLKSFLKLNQESTVLSTLGQALRDLIEQTYEFHKEQIKIENLRKNSSEMGSILYEQLQKIRAKSHLSPAGDEGTSDNDFQSPANTPPVKTRAFRGVTASSRVITPQTLAYTETKPPMAVPIIPIIDGQMKTKNFREIMEERRTRSEAPQSRIIEPSSIPMPMPSHALRYQPEDKKPKPPESMPYKVPQGPLKSNEFLERLNNGSLLKSQPAPAAAATQQESPSTPTVAVPQNETPLNVASPQPMVMSPSKLTFTLDETEISSPSTPPKDIRQETGPLLSAISPIPFSVTTPTSIPNSVFSTSTPEATADTLTASCAQPSPTPTLLFSDMAVISPTKTATPSAIPTVLTPLTPPKPLPEEPIAVAKPQSLSGPSNPGAAPKVVETPKPVMPPEPIAPPKPPALSIKEEPKKPLILSTVPTIQAALKQGIPKEEVDRAIERVWNSM